MIAQDELIQAANRALDFLANSSQKDWFELLEETLPAGSVETNAKTIREKLVNMGLDNPTGAIVGGTGMIREALQELDGETAQEIVKLLKHTNRLHQCGRGRGLALVVLTDDHIPADEQVEQVVEMPAQVVDMDEPMAIGEDGRIDANDIPTIFKVLRDRFRDQQRQVREMVRLDEAKQRRIAELETEAARKDAHIHELEAQLERSKALAGVATWQ